MRTAADRMIELTYAMRDAYATTEDLTTAREAAKGAEHQPYARSDFRPPLEEGGRGAKATFSCSLWPAVKPRNSAPAPSKARRQLLAAPELGGEIRSGEDQRGHVSDADQHVTEPHG